MKILVLAGTSDARELALHIHQEGYEMITTVVTDNAAQELQKVGIPVHVGRLTQDEMATFVHEQYISIIVDASHPFAEEASKNAIAAAKQVAVPYIRYERDSQTFTYPNMTVVDSYEAAAEAAAKKQGVVMLTTGSKTLEVFTSKLLHLPETRLLARMLPRADNMEKCEQLQLPQKNIIAMQGPFTREFDRALYQQYGVTVMITKESGKVGSVDEKVEAAKELGIHIILIRRPQIEYGIVYSSFTDVVAALGNIPIGQ